MQQNLNINETNKNVFFYLIGTCMAELTVLPLYTILTNYQTSNLSMKNTIKSIYKKKSFYSSAQYAIMSRLISSGIKYSLYQNLKLYRNTKNDDLFGNMINSCISGCIGGVVSHPFDVMVNCKQRGVPIDFKFSSLFCGFGGTIIRNFILYTFLFSMFDYIKHNTDNILAACIATTFITTSILQPIDYIRTNVMTGKIKYNQIQLKNCYRGYYLNYPRNAINFTITMCVAHNMEYYFNYS